MNEYIAALVDEFAQLGITYAVFSPGRALQRWPCYLGNTVLLKPI